MSHQLEEKTIFETLSHRGYTLLERLDNSGEARSYIIRDNREDEGYCLLRVRPADLDRIEEETLLLREIHKKNGNVPAMAPISHTVSCFGVGGQVCTLRKYIPGQPLSWAVDPDGWSSEQVLTLLRSILTTLSLCHGHNLVHGSLHPNNIIQQADGQLFLTDFSVYAQHCSVLCLTAEPGSFIHTNISGRLGRQAYFAPEQLALLEQPELITPGAPIWDIYALGMIALQLLLGYLPWSSKHQLEQHLATLPEQHLVSVVRRMVAVSPEQRYQTAQDVLLDLDADTDIQHDKSTVSPLSVSEVSSSIETEIAAEVPQVNTALLLSSPTFLPMVPAELDIKEHINTAVQPAEIQLADDKPSNGSAVEPTRKSLLKWTPAILGLVASVGGIALYGLQGQVEPTVTTAQDADPQATSLPELSEVPATATLPVPSSPDRPVEPSFSASETDHYFVQAARHAKAREFSKALLYLEQIPASSSQYVVAQSKIAEYRDKRENRAQFLLSQAYEQAAVQNFEQALAYLYEIPTDASGYETARQKIAEYLEQGLQADTVLRSQRS